MKELIIDHIPAKKDHSARVKVGYRPTQSANALEREVDFNFVFAEEQRKLIQWYLEEYLHYPWGEFRNRAKEVEQAMVRLGEQLFQAIFSSAETAALYGKVTDHLADTRIIIRATDPAGITIPWELMRDPVRGEYGGLLQQAHCFVRSQSDLIVEPATPASDETLRILMVISRPSGGDKDVPFQSVARPLLELLRPHRERIELEVLRPPTFEQLERVLSANPNYYHVLHFNGQGTFPQGRSSSQFYGQDGRQGQLVFEGEDGKPRLVSGTELGQLLVGKGVPLVLLNACQSGMTHPESLYPSLGNQLLKAGASGVVAMAYSVYVQTAARFMARLYSELINGADLAKAVQLGRQSLRTHPQRTSPIGEIELQDWMVPLLFEAVPYTPLPQSSGERVVLNPDLLEHKQAKAGTEINCPDPPVLGFIGRDNVVFDLEHAFEHETIVLLKGMAGVGKTQMAMACARFRAETGALDGPIFFFRFEHYLPVSQVCDRVGELFNDLIRKELKVEWHLLQEDQRRVLAVQLLRQIPCFLIWDNFEPVTGFPTGSKSEWKTEEQQALRDFLSDLKGGQTKALITSRREESWLKDLYYSVEMKGLKKWEAEQLALLILQRALTPDEIKKLPDYTRLLNYLQGNPLAMQVILPELKSSRPDALLEKLISGEAKLKGDDPQQRQERSLAASLTYRLDAIDETMRKRLGLLALFQGFVNTRVLAGLSTNENAPELIRELKAEDWLRILDSAAEIGILSNIGEGFYSMHPALLWFFHDLLQEAYPDEIAGLEQMFCLVYGSMGQMLSQTFTTNTARAIFLLSREEDNLRYALQLGLSYERWDEIQGILYGLNKLLVTRGRWVEWERMIIGLEGSVADSKDQPLPERQHLWTALLGHRAEIAMYYRNFEQAHTIHLQLKAHFERSDDQYNVAVSLHQLGRIAEERRQFDEAQEWYRQSLAIAERTGNEHGQTLALHQLGRIAQERRQFDQADGWYRQSLEIEERIGDEHGKAASLGQLGVVSLEMRRPAEAEQFYRQSLEIKERIGNEHGQAISLHELGMIALEQRRFDEAERWYRQSLEINERIGDEHGQAISLHQLGTIAEERRQFDEAERWYRRSLEIEERIGNEHGQAISLHQLGRIAEERRQFDEAERWYRRSLEINERIGDEHGQASTLHQLGIIAQERRQFDEAERWYHLSLEIEERTGDERGQVQTIHQLGNSAFLRGDLNRAEEFYQLGIVRNKGLNNSFGLMRGYYQLGRVAQKRIQFDEAAQWYHESLKIAAFIGDYQSQAIAFHQLGMIAQEQKEFEEAREWYRQSLALKEQIGDDRGVAATLHQMGMIAETLREIDRARRLYTQSEAILIAIQDLKALETVRASLGRLDIEDSQSAQGKELSP